MKDHAQLSSVGEGDPQSVFNCSRLALLELESNKLSQFPLVSRFAALQSLNLEHNKITSLSFPGSPPLLISVSVQLYLYQSIHHVWDLSQSPEFLPKPTLSSFLSLAECKKLTHLSLAHNLITHEALSPLPVTSLLHDLPRLSTLTLHGNPVWSDVGYHRSFALLLLPHCPLFSLLPPINNKNKKCCSDFEWLSILSISLCIQFR